MRRRVRLIASATVLAVIATLPAPAVSPARAQSSAPHAWLFGSWTGGLFPAPTGLTAEACLAQPVVIFTRDLVLRATLTEQTYTQRAILAVRGTADGLEFRFEPTGGGGGAANLLGLPAPTQDAGFGCASNDELIVQRRGENEIVFPSCSEFPNPLVRCPAR